MKSKKVKESSQRKKYSETNLAIILCSKEVIFCIYL